MSKIKLTFNSATSAAMFGIAAASIYRGQDLPAVCALILGTIHVSTYLILSKIENIPYQVFTMVIRAMHHMREEELDQETAQYKQRMSEEDKPL